jgi:hypothetical protein
MLRDTIPRPPRSSHWLDLAFVAALALCAVLIALGRLTTGSLATICLALDRLCEAWMRLRPQGETPTSSTSQPERQLPDGRSGED